MTSHSMSESSDFCWRYEQFSNKQSNLFSIDTFEIVFQTVNSNSRRKESFSNIMRVMLRKDLKR